MYNKVILMGRLVKDPELKTTNSGKAVVSATIAVDRQYKNSNGEKQTDFFNITAWEGKAEFISKYFSKGKLILVDGELQNRKYTDKNGENRQFTEVLVSTVSFTGEKQGSSERLQPQGNNEGNLSSNSQKALKSSVNMEIQDDNEEYPF